VPRSEGAPRKYKGVAIIFKHVSGMPWRVSQKVAKKAAIVKLMPDKAPGRPRIETVKCTGGAKVIRKFQNKCQEHMGSPRWTLTSGT